MKPSDATVLVADGKAVMRNAVAQQLRSAGFTQILTADSGELALHHLETTPVSLILSDWVLPGLSGLDLLLEIRGAQALRHIPFIMITAELERERVIEAITAGVDDLLLKPFKSDELLRKVETALLGSPSRPAQASPAPEAPERRLPTVLVVDDLPANLTLVAGLLRPRCTVKLATRGDKALEIARTNPPDLILLDIMMPGMDGFEVCRRLQEDPGTAYIPVIFLTALAEVDKTVAGFELGAIDYVTKPIEPEVLKARVTSALRIARAHEDLRAQYDLAVENARLREEVGRRSRHDLKAPIASIIELSSALLGSGALGGVQRDQARAIQRTANTLLGLTED